jgi:hypothetical protein
MKRALSAVERLVVSVFFVAILIGLYAVYVMGSRYLRMTQLQSQIQLQASLALQKVAGDLSQTIDDPRALHCDPLCILSAEQEATSPERFLYDESGHLQWSRWIGYKLEADSHQLLRAEVVLEAPQRRPFENLLQPTQDTFLLAPRRVVVADCLDRLEVTRAALGLYTVKVAATLPGVDGEVCKTQLDTEVYLINGGIP